jgi:hypothetical protein
VLSEQAAQQVDSILTISFRDSERHRHDDVRNREAELERHGRLRSGAHRQQVLAAFDEDLERRVRAIQSALLRVLELDLVGDTEAVGETLTLAFQKRFEEQARRIEAALPRTRGLEDLSLTDPQVLGAAICAELQLAGREYLRRVRPPSAILDLLPEQERLLGLVVEAARSVPPAGKAPFYLLPRQGLRPRGKLEHPGLPGGQDTAYSGDVEELSNKGLLRLRYTDQGDHAFDVSPEGFRYYEELRRRQGSGVDRVERFTRELIDSARFREHYAEAFERWSQAESLLWRSDVEAHLTTVGHTLREAIQQFATTLVERYRPPGVNESPTADQARVKAILALVESSIGKTTREVLSAYWATTSNLVQRLEHGAQKEGEAVTWDDARRAVFLVASAFLEIDGAVGRARP